MPPTSPDTPSSPQHSAGRKGLSQILKIFVITLLLVVSFLYAVRDVKWTEVWDSIFKANLVWVLASSLVTLLSHYLRAERWRLLIPEGKAIRIINAFSATMIGYFMNNVIPRSGEFVRPYALARREGRSTSSLLATVVVERVIDGITLLGILVGIIFVISHELATLIDAIPILRGSTPSDLILQLGIPVGVLLLLLIVIITTRLGDAVVDRLARILPERFGAKLRELFAEFREGARFRGGVSGFLRTSILSVLIWLGYAVSFQCSIYAFGFDDAYGLGFGASLVLLGVTAVGITIAPTPGGFGVFHAFCRVTLVALYGVPVDQAVAFAFVQHMAQYLVALILGGFFFMREGMSLSEASGKGSEKGKGRKTPDEE